MKETLKTINLNRATDMREKIKKLTAYTDEQMNQLMFDIAVGYSKYSMGMSEDWLTVWLREPIFWAWWRQQWTLVDEVYWHKYQINLNHPKIDMNRDEIIHELRNRYVKLHSSIDRFPDNIVYEKIHCAYKVMSHQLLTNILSNQSNL